MSDADLLKRIEALEAQVAQLRSALDGHVNQVEPDVSEDVALVIAAALAAYLGERAKITKIRKLKAAGLESWRIQGRVAIQGSHTMRN